eukprot:GHVU01212039.1.p1 GENE.GHVU01212039.1~~GHVU01212039.1.p1  ORF type:complete len:129 (+),score=22.02 GHVU01212039.1:1208-1594(+)
MLRMNCRYETGMADAILAGMSEGAGGRIDSPPATRQQQQRDGAMSATATMSRRLELMQECVASSSYLAAANVPQAPPTQYRKFLYAAGQHSGTVHTLLNVAARSSLPLFFALVDACPAELLPRLLDGG